MTPQEIEVQAKAAAKKIATELKIPWQWIFGQWAYESTSNGYKFGSGLAMKNLNLGGIKGSGNWRYYTSVDSFAEDYKNLILKEYPKVAGASSIDAFATALSQHKGGGSYFGGASVASYAAGIKARLQGVEDVTATNTAYTPKAATITQHNETVYEKLESWASNVLNGGSTLGSDSTADVIAARKSVGLDTTELESSYNKYSAANETALDKAIDAVSFDPSEYLDKGIWVVIGVAMFIMGLVLIMKGQPMVGKEAI